MVASGGRVMGYYRPSRRRNDEETDPPANECATFRTTMTTDYGRHFAFLGFGAVYVLVTRRQEVQSKRARRLFVRAAVAAMFSLLLYKSLHIAAADSGDGESILPNRRQPRHHLQLAKYPTTKNKRPYWHWSFVVGRSSEVLWRAHRNFDRQILAVDRKADEREAHLVGVCSPKVTRRADC